MDTLKLKLLKYPSVFVVYDRNVEVYAKSVAGKRPALPIDTSEKTKTIDTVMMICGWLLENGADRSSLVLAIGGGVTTDMVGFAASIYKRGIRYANVPTTLLSQVDAGIGGKTGVNFSSFKNMIGVIRQPEFVHINIDVLRSLPDREFRSGAAEMLKTFIIADRKSYSQALNMLSGPRDFKALEPLVKEAGKIKQRIVRKDPDEKGLRRVLNFGHTYGHAIEWWQQTHGVAEPLSHGEAVAIGMIMAAEESEERGIAKAGMADKLRADFKYCQLPVNPPCSKDDLAVAVRTDKKAESGKLNFVFIKDIGSVVVKKI